MKYTKSGVKLKSPYVIRDNYILSGSTIWTITINGEELLHREDGPAIIYYYEGLKIWGEEYYINGKKHKEDGPAVIYYKNNKEIYSETYFYNGKIHREDGPAVIYYKKGIKTAEYYWLNQIYICQDDIIQYKQSLEEYKNLQLWG